MPVPVHPSIDTAFLEFLAESLGRAVADNGTGVLVHVAAAAGADGPDIGVLPLDGQAPAEVLLGAVAPEHWSVLGVATTGRAWPLDRHAGTRPGRAEIVVLATRDGRVVGRARAGGRVITEPPASGLTLDCLQRALGLPTAPPDVPPAHLVAVVLLERALAGGPAAEAEGLLAAFEAPGPALEWGRLRHLMARARPDAGQMPDDPDWFDDGAFARWALSRYRPVPVLLAEARRTLGPAGARHCARILDRLGVAAE